MLKRLVAAASLSAVSLLGFVPVASAATLSAAPSTKVVYVQTATTATAIDWHAPPLQRRIDWD
ncbi:hypothetical protein [Aeromicrobium sp.]|uniref:hypothetical protein n=1 Tax=Aeromicrobium sp. TaxID=1871063 RepID=UPI0019A2FEEF|nr:hypothetical protein [Aeromicrobium sp.]MBC7630013.1 hypothetical protein [Aeromicrobium sp.]